MYFSLVTGGAGFIGSHLVRELVDRGDRVRVLDNFSTGKIENLANPSTLLRAGLDGTLEILEGDLRDHYAVKQSVQGVDYVFHQAAFVSVPKSMLEPQECLEVNVQGTLNLLEVARKAGVRKVVLASSCAVYGDSQSLPLHETSATYTLSPYAASKLVNEVFAGLYTRAFGLPVVVLRYFNVYGPRQSPYSNYAAVIPIFIRRMLDRRAPTIFGDGHQRRDFIYVSDVVRANITASESSEAAGEVFNICTGQETSLLDLLETLAEILPDTPAPEFTTPRPGDIHRSLGDPRRAAQTLGFIAQVSLSEGLVKTVEWMRKMDGGREDEYARKREQK